jgi:hypothetical protein
MITYFTNRKLAERLGINLAKWKRWSREFLPPDPLGGLQSGYARQYRPDEAFTVYLGGHLVANGKFSIPEAKQIVKDLNEWLADNGFHFDVNATGLAAEASDGSPQKVVIFILKRGDGDGGIAEFSYIVRGIIAQKAVAGKDRHMVQALYTETFINAAEGTLLDAAVNFAVMLNIKEILIRFVKSVGLDETRYAALNRPARIDSQDL